MYPVPPVRNTFILPILSENDVNSGGILHWFKARDFYRGTITRDHPHVSGRAVATTPGQRIIGFYQDMEQHWVAVLECGHRQHVRHTPPWEVRPWVLTAAGRADHLGTMLPCRLCEGECPRSARGFQVRRAEPSDAPEWARLRQALWPAESSEELAAEVEAFFSGRDTLLRAVFLA